MMLKRTQGHTERSIELVAAREARYGHGAAQFFERFLHAIGPELGEDLTEDDVGDLYAQWLAIRARTACRCVIHGGELSRGEAFALCGGLAVRRFKHAADAVPGGFAAARLAARVALLAGMAVALILVAGSLAEPIAHLMGRKP